MKVLRLPVDADFAESSLAMAVDMLHGAGEDVMLLHIIVSPAELFNAKRKMQAIEAEPGSTLMKMLSRHACIEANYEWDTTMRASWLVLGRHHIVYTSGSGRLNG